MLSQLQDDSLVVVASYKQQGSLFQLCTLFVHRNVKYFVMPGTERRNQKLITNCMSLGSRTAMNIMKIEIYYKI